VRRSHLLLAAPAAIALVAGSLAACSAAPSGSSTAAACEPAASGSASDSVQVSGDFGAKLTLDSATPITAGSTTQRTVLIDGDPSGQEAVDGMEIDVYYTLWNGANGDLIESGADISSDAVPLAIDATQLNTGFLATLRCSTPGTRVVGVIPPAEGVGDQGSQFGLGANDALIFVADVKSVEPLPTSEPTSSEPLPTVSKDSSISRPTVDLSTTPPTVTLPAGDPPTALDVQVVAAGTGAPVAAGASVTVNYLGVNWDTAAVFDESYTSSPATFTLDGVIPGFAQAIEGQPVGSTLLVTIPPDLAYGTDTGDANTSGTLVFVIDIVSAQ